MATTTTAPPIRTPSSSHDALASSASPATAPVAQIAVPTAIPATTISPARRDRAVAKCMVATKSGPGLITTAAHTAARTPRLGRYRTVDLR